MNTAMAIISHAVRMLTYDTRTTLQILLPPLALVVGSAAAAAVLAPSALHLLYIQVPNEDLPTVASLAVLLGLGIIGLTGYALMAILWHRHVLLNGDARSAALRPDVTTVFSYLWRATLVGLVQMLVSIPIAFAMALVGGAALSTGASPSLLIFVVLGVLSGVLFLWVALRISVVLPAAAMDRKMRIAESWQITASAATPILGVALILALLNGVISLAATTLLPDAPGVRLVFETAIYALEGLVFISVLTTLYGHLVEGRPLDQPTEE